jgi:zinc finger protein CreA/MIG
MDENLMSAISRAATKLSETFGTSGANKAAKHGEKGYTCHICGKEFNNTHSLDIHFREHAGDTPHVCTFLGCGKVFVTLSLLDEHSRNHTQFRCSGLWWIF